MRKTGDESGKAAALSGLGEVYESRGDHPTSLNYHQEHLVIAQTLGDRGAQIKACLNIGRTYESMKSYDSAKSYYEQCLSTATLVNDRVAKIKALGNLGQCNLYILNSNPWLISQTCN